jgi:hypothetical protein
MGKKVKCGDCGKEGGQGSIVWVKELKKYLCWKCRRRRHGRR